MISELKKSRNAFYDDLPVPDYDQILNCIHCGLCLPTCPTYEVSGLEKDSPRGRIRMLKSIADGDLQISPTFMESMDFCLDCQACVTACPAGVEYGLLVEAARNHIEAEKKQRGEASRLKPLILKLFFLKKKNLFRAAVLMKLYQKSGLKSLIEKSGVLRLFSAKLHELNRMAPVVKKTIRYNTLYQAPGKEKRGKVGVVTGCVQDVFYSDVNRDTIEVLRYNGYDVVVPQNQECCGSVMGHTGEHENACMLAKKLIDDFYDAGVDAVIINAAGCGSFMKHYDHLLRKDVTHGEKARWFTERVFDIMEFLDLKGWQPPVSSGNQKVTYHDACHLAHGQKVMDGPRRVLKAIEGIKYKELEEASWCCGSAGIYNITRYDDAMVFLERKMKHVEESGAQIVLAGNPGCIIQLAYGNEYFKSDVKIMHPVSFIKQCYDQDSGRSSDEK